jgi:mannose-1-phosphate guanylyltransferase
MRTNPFNSMPSVSSGHSSWAVLLAGGDGTRLQSLTTKIAGDSRPKQFCPLFGGKTLLSQTQERLAPLFRPDQTVFVVTRHHEEFYRDDLQDVVDSRMIVQPRNRGTGVAIAAALFRILKLQNNPLVAFFPCDHYYSNDEAFGQTVAAAMEFAGDRPTEIVLIGAEAASPEVEYGWIEPGRTIQRFASIPLMRVNRFWEKPSLPKAGALLEQGCLWNTFVTIGYASTFLDLLRLQVPDAMPYVAAGLGHNNLEAAYRAVRPIDFSREVLTPLPGRLLVVRDTGSGWADLGTPERVIDTLVRNRIEPAWLNEMRLMAGDESSHAGNQEHYFGELWNATSPK